MMYPFIKVDSQLFNDTLALPRGCLCFATGIWTLGNVAGDSPPKRDACLQAGALLAILPILDRCRGMGDAEMQRWLGMGMLKGRETSQVSRLGCGNFQTYGKLVLPCESIHVFFYLCQCKDHSPTSILEIIPRVLNTVQLRSLIV